MDQKIIIRNIIRVLGIIAGFGTAIAAFAFRSLEGDNYELFTKLCVVSRVCAIVLFVLAIGFLVFDIIAKAYPISIGAIGVVIALIAFIGSFVVAPASSLESLREYSTEHANYLTGKVDVTQLEIGSYMILAGGLFYASYHMGCMKKGK